MNTETIIPDFGETLVFKNLNNDPEPNQDPPIHTAYRFIIDTVPQAVQSVRFSKTPWGIRKYQPKKVTEWKNYIRLSVSESIKKEANFRIFENCPVSLIINYIFPPPKSLRKAEREAIARGELIPKFTRPDVGDNLNKGILDALTGLLWRDDGQIQQIAAAKYYGHLPYIDIAVSPSVSTIVEPMQKVYFGEQTTENLPLFDEIDK